MTFVYATVTALIGGVLNLDRTALLQIMVSRPLVASGIIGALIGDLHHGLVIGVLLELLWLGELPVGAHVTTNETALTAVITAVALLSAPSPGGVDRGLIAFVILLFLPLGLVFRRVDEAVRRFNNRVSREVAESAGREGERAIRRGLIKGVMAFLLPNLLLIWLSILAGVYVVRSLYPVLEGSVPFEGIFFIIPLVGIGSVLSSLKVKGYPLIFGLGVILFSILFLQD